MKHGKSSRRWGRPAAIICSLLATVVTLTPGQSFAEEKTKPRKVLKLEVITVEGRIQKPQAFYILQRSNLNFGELEKTESFLPKIVQSVNHEPF